MKTTISIALIVGSLSLFGTSSGLHAQELPIVGVDSTIRSDSWMARSCLQNLTGCEFIA
jgi:hypothetical protein